MAGHTLHYYKNFDLFRDGKPLTKESHDLICTFKRIPVARLRMERGGQSKNSEAIDNGHVRPEEMMSPGWHLGVLYRQKR